MPENNGWPRQEALVLAALERLEASQEKGNDRLRCLEIKMEQRFGEIGERLGRVDERTARRAGFVAAGVTLMGVGAAVLLRLL